MVRIGAIVMLISERLRRIIKELDEITYHQAETADPRLPWEEFNYHLCDGILSIQLALATAIKAGL
jgi:hypothetical protein